ncbi:hypothetical protein SPRG_15004 [Saprolegnia parasitica CBS 223.65]|uniref:Uncharacterized protein n=1 Tax=Saprolegnia parasitica (strain CBS 223.65) TaxID=695850 RepID=A0A067BQJ3_SAPPC|nr:hypothetical protein SPRG_15004 [Saprolegnia parasitica CBS 223.65]KDO19050.1 hypothetical protein SPRG_15004 [Saprolegnia parasitica CBS 223.65]|eukprot:XP_012210238.1 hypothetical protein SPRG_15004 [Saprolegnia parasitica CBS 223.65]
MLIAAACIASIHVCIASLEKLKDDNQELYAKLVARCRQRTPAAGSPVKIGSLACVHCIEDAVLYYFLCEKHWNVLYFSVADPARGRPYDLTPATSGKGEHYVLSSKHLVHVKPIPLFQQLLRRRMVMHSRHYVRQRMYRSTTLLGQLHCGRPMHASALREIQMRTSHRIQSQRALRLAATKPSMSLAHAHATQFKELEAQLVDRDNTTLSALNAADMFEMRHAYPGWTSLSMPI